MYIREFHISQDFICLNVIICIVFGFRQTQPHAFNKLHISESVIIICDFIIDMMTDIYIVYRPGYFTVAHGPAPSGPKFSNSENCCGSENAMLPKIFWDMEGHRGHFRSKNVFFFKKHILEKIHNKSHYFFKF